MANNNVMPKKKHVTKFLVSLIDATNGTEPICQSCDSVAGHKSSHQLNAAK